MDNSKFISVKNNDQAIPLQAVPELAYQEFSALLCSLMDDPFNHCVNYYTVPWQEKYLRFFCIMARDRDKDILIFSHIQDKNVKQLASLTALHFPLHIFEREIYENTGICFTGHPWLKPVRFPGNRSDLTKGMNDYPFYAIESEELHEVGVGPIHAGVIEPGHFRFICNGEKVMHLEIHLGYQHRGVEDLFLKKDSMLARMILSESIAGDTAV
jgi:NADH:ubiquinone oxidoreductase subunit C